MIQFNTKYDLNNGAGWIIFKSGGSGIVSAEYNRGTIQGNWDGETLKGQFIDTVSKGQGLIEFRFNENGFEAKWKAGIDKGPMKGKWLGKIEVQKSKLSTDTEKDSLDFNQSRFHPWELSKQLKATIHSICKDISSDRASKFESDISSFVTANPEYHWALFFCRQCQTNFIENNQPENDSDYNRLVELFSFVDNDEISNFATIDVNLDKLAEIDFMFNTNLSIWQSEGIAETTFLDATFLKWELEKKLVKKDVNAGDIYLRNVVLTMISRNFAELTRSKYNLDSMSYAKIIWTILENSISSCDKQDIVRTYFSEDEDYVLVVDSIYFYFEQLLNIDLESEYNSESDESYTKFQGYRTDFVALSESLLEMDLFDL